MLVSPQLRILQYNVCKEKNGTMASLLHKPAAASELDIIAIQEPWQNPFYQTSFNPPDSEFQLAYTLSTHTRVCFFINNRIDLDSWEIDNADNPNITTLLLNIMCEDAPATNQIHNIYSLSPHHQMAIETPMVDELVAHLRTTPDTLHVVVGDFNLHHPSWRGPRCLTQHMAADRLLNVAAEAALKPTLLPGTITWRVCTLESTIDLTFVSATLTPQVISYQPVDHWEQSSDHRPILTHLDLAMTEETPRP